MSRCRCNMKGSVVLLWHRGGTWHSSCFSNHAAMVWTVIFRKSFQGPRFIGSVMLGLPMDDSQMLPFCFQSGADGSLLNPSVSLASSKAYWNIVIGFLSSGPSVFLYSLANISRLPNVPWLHLDQLIGRLYRLLSLANSSQTIHQTAHILSLFPGYSYFILCSKPLQLILQTYSVQASVWLTRATSILRLGAIIESFHGCSL